MTTYTIADLSVRALLAEIVRQYHPELHECEARVGILMAYNPEGNAVKNGGYGAFASIKVVNLKDRITKNYDAELLIDQTLWEELDSEEFELEKRSALIDHELSHLKVVPNTPDAIREGESKWKTDDIGRPKLKTKPADWNTGDGFALVIQRWGANAIEFRNIDRARLLALTAKRVGEEQREAEERGTENDR